MLALSSIAETRQDSGLDSLLGIAAEKKPHIKEVGNITVKFEKNRNGTFNIHASLSKKDSVPYLYEIFLPEITKEDAIKVFHDSGIFGSKNCKASHCRKQIKQLSTNATKHHVYFEKRSSHNTKLTDLIEKQSESLGKNLESSSINGISGLNEHFHDSYDRLIYRALKTLGTCKRPVALFFNDQVRVYYPGRVDESTVYTIETVFPFVTKRYEIIKGLSHGAVVPINDIVEPRTDEGKSERWLHRRDEVIRLLESQGVIDELPSDITSLEKIRLELLKFYKETKTPPSLSETISFMGSLQGEFSEALRLAHEENIQMVHAAIQRIRHIVGDNWEHTYCVVAGNHHAQSEEVTSTTIKKVRGDDPSTDPSKEKNVMYAILPTTEGNMLLLLAEHISNSKIAHGMFDDPKYLNADALRQHKP